MQTLKTPINYEGMGLISGKHNKLEFIPAPKGTGILFVNSLNKKSFKVSTEKVIDTTHCVVLGSPEFFVKVPEHLLATLSLLNIKDIEIHLTGDEVPIADGSGQVFYDLLSKNVADNHIPIQKYNLNKPLYFSLNHTSIMAIPYNGFKISYAVNYVNSIFSYAWYKWEVNVDAITDIISSRTFGYMKDLPVFQSQGMALGVTRDNTIGLNDDGTFTTELRSPNEPIRHKILDVIGDLFLTGLTPYDLNAHIVVIECGHYQHIELAKLIKKELNI